VGKTEELILPRTQLRPLGIGYHRDELAAAPPFRPGTTAEAASAGAGTTIVVSIQANDALIGAGAAAYLRSRPGLVPVLASAAPVADVILVLAGQVRESTVAWMQQAARRTSRSNARFVLVGDGERPPWIESAVASGLVSVLPWRGSDFERIVDAIHRTARPAGTQLRDRELEVLRLLADGLSTLEIASRLNYSERTVKNIIHGVVSRLNLRNRTHAVAFALRNGLL
jgi:DNA-binding NarL/FixJ family response regulator